jgi:hypothetical protein
MPMDNPPVFSNFVLVLLSINVTFVLFVLYTLIKAVAKFISNLIDRP